ncbi:MAG TPA: hypothetical protein VKU03_10915 [Roseiarcus sp.]|nr:hypothetical protein [Roseiarcus sp.]
MEETRVDWRAFFLVCAVQRETGSMRERYFKFLFNDEKISTAKAGNPIILRQNRSTNASNQPFYSFDKSAKGAARRLARLRSAFDGGATSRIQARP